MGVPYRESFGEDGYDDENPDVLSRWDGELPEKLTRMRYDWDTHLWACSCSSFVHTGKCKHVYRWRREVTVVVNEEYL